MLGSRSLEPLNTAYSTLPAAGETYLDRYGTTVTRVTDEASGTLCTHYLPWGEVFNSDETLMLIFRDWFAWVYRLVDGVFKPYKRLNDLTSKKLNSMSACWSTSVPSVLYILEKAPTGQPRTQNLLEMNVETGAVKVLRNFSAEFSGTDLDELSMSEDGKKFGLRAVYSDGIVYPFAWDVLSDKVRSKEAGRNIHSVAISRDGQWLQVVTSYPQATWNFWRIGTDEYVSLLEGNSSNTGILEHPFMGRLGLSCGLASDNSVVIRRWESLSSAYQALLPLPWEAAYHISGRKIRGAEASLIVSTYGKAGKPGVNMIIEVFFDGTFRVLADTRSSVDSFLDPYYWWQPRASVSRSGKYVVWTSGLGSSSRTDVLMMTLPPTDDVLAEKDKVSDREDWLQDARDVIANQERIIADQSRDLLADLDVINKVKEIVNA